jgi:outer membrane protein OmpA-like peptidoglycan-associated protein
MRSFAATVAVAVLLAACAGQKLKGQTRTVDEQIVIARDNGAIRCAPVELAMAESHNDFAKQELSEGNYHAAKRELAIAEQNARAAIEKSPKDRCNPDDVPYVEAPPADTDGDGLADPVDECPRKPEDKDGFQDEDGCPEDDNDSDGIADKIDDCPLDPEDRDGTDDTDGCPDPDNDHDGLADKIDQCPDDPEDADGFEDDDGCPDCDNDGDGVPECPDKKDKCPAEAGPGTEDGCPQKYDLVVVTETKIELKQTVYFDTKKAKIKRVSYPLLDDVAKALKDYPTIKVRIEGHTDSQGKDKFNLGLSQRRAESVRKYLIGKGIDGGRMVAEGFGEEVPIADNRTKEGRAQNRRVEFFITER